MDYNILIQILVGLTLLFLGRKLFWLFVAASGFLAGTLFVQRYMTDFDPLVGLAVALVAGLVGAALALLVQRVAVAVAGFLLGVIFVFQLRDVWSLPLEGLTLWIGAVIGGLIGLALVVALFDIALVILSSMAGAQMILASFDLALVLRSLAFVLLLVIGIAIQLQSLRRRRTEPV